MKNLIGLLVLIGMASFNTVQAGGDIEAGRALSTSCSACHGTDGMSNSEQWPNLAGQKESYLVAQLNKYRDGDRTDPTMSAIVGPLTADDVNNLAAFYASKKAIASYSFGTNTLRIPYVDVGGSMFYVEMLLEDVNTLDFRVSTLQPL